MKHTNFIQLTLASIVGGGTWIGGKTGAVTGCLAITLGLVPKSIASGSSSTATTSLPWSNGHESPLTQKPFSEKLQVMLFKVSLKVVLGYFL